MPKKKAGVFSPEMKLATIRQMIAGENVSAWARELKLRRKLPYAWREPRGRARCERAAGRAGLRERGRCLSRRWTI
jgi:transposase-like protein